MSLTQTVTKSPPRRQAQADGKRTRRKKAETPVALAVAPAAPPRPKCPSCDHVIDAPGDGAYTGVCLTCQHHTETQVRKRAESLTGYARDRFFYRAEIAASRGLLLCPCQCNWREPSRQWCSLCAIPKTANLPNILLGVSLVPAPAARIPLTSEQCDAILAEECGGRC